MIESCAEHRALVERALGPDATDADLLSYAEEVPACPRCSRLLAVGAGVHPAHLEQPPDDALAAIACPWTLEDEHFCDALVSPGKSSTLGPADPHHPIEGRIARV